MKRKGILNLIIVRANYPYLISPEIYIAGKLTNLYWNL
jgi:hypothetical protein